MIGLHGWGANALDLASVGQVLHLPNYELLFPDAPFQHPYAPNGKMWYSFPGGPGAQASYDFRQLPDLIESRKRLVDWLRSLEQSTEVPLSRTVLAGFSQGGAMTLDVGAELPLAGLMVLSGYLHAPLPADGAFPPVLIVHGRYDQMVPITAARQARDALLKRGAEVQYHEFDMAHEICPAVLPIMQSFIEERGFPPDQISKTP